MLARQGHLLLFNLKISDAAHSTAPLMLPPIHLTGEWCWVNAERHLKQMHWNQVSCVFRMKLSESGMRSSLSFPYPSLSISSKHAFIHSFTHALVHSFIHSVIHYTHLLPLGAGVYCLSICRWQ